MKDDTNKGSTTTELWITLQQLSTMSAPPVYRKLQSSALRILCLYFCVINSLVIISLVIISLVINSLVSISFVITFIVCVLRSTGYSFHDIYIQYTAVTHLHHQMSFNIDPLLAPCHIPVRITVHLLLSHIAFLPRSPTIIM